MRLWLVPLVSVALWVILVLAGIGFAELVS